jgi:hypothetical protein
MRPGAVSRRVILSIWSGHSDNSEAQEHDMARYLPNSQKAAQTRGSAPSKTALSRARYTAQDAAGDPGIGRRGMGVAM